MNTGQYQNKYRIASTRLAGWDYGSNAAYFITICAHNRVHAFGEVIEGQVHLTPLGETAWECWDAIPEHFPFVVLDGFVAMPNHVHGIVSINKPSPNLGDAGDSDDHDGRDDRNVVETQNFASLRSLPGSLPGSSPGASPRVASPRYSPNRFGPQSQNLASIMRGFKIGVTKYARQHQIPFDWQERYHDHIIRNAAEHERIRQYIRENPQKWAEDCFYDP